MSEPTRGIARRGEAQVVSLDRLLLDPENPRLPESAQGGSQVQLAATLALGFDVITVAESVATHGYFASEPLIAVPLEGSSVLTVVEGNRRLAALLGLTRPDIRREYPEVDRWENLAARAAIPRDVGVPVVVVGHRSEVTPIVGYRHISGILQWSPFAQARYVAKLVDVDGMDLATVAKTIGVDKSRVAHLYRDQAIATQAAALGIDTVRLERSFSLLTVAMSSPKLREHIGAPIASWVSAASPPIPVDKTPEFRELLRWIFGEGVTPPAIRESRDIAKLANVVASHVGLRALRDGESLQQAVQRVKDADDDPETRLRNRLRTGRNALAAALDDVAGFAGDSAVVGLIDEAHEAVQALLAAVREEEPYAG